MRPGEREGRAGAPQSKRVKLPASVTLCVAIVVLSLILGGGGVLTPYMEMIVQVLTALLMIPLVLSDRMQRGLGPIPVASWVLAALAVVVPVVQLVPLPPSVWQALPGRAVELGALAAAGEANRWMPLSMAPARTFASLLSMACSTLIMLQVSRLTVKGRTWLCGSIVFVAGLSLVLGMLQLSHTGGYDWSLYTFFSRGFLVGFQANRNSEADVLLISALAFCVLIVARLANRRASTLSRFAVAIGFTPIIVGIFMTGSRTGIALIAVMAVVVVVMLRPLLRLGRQGWMLAGGSTLALIAGCAALAELPAVQKVLGRFGPRPDARWDIWTDTHFAIGQVWPYGSGVGSIVPMLEAAERLETVSIFYPVRAHNDWLEWTMEAGVPGMVVLALIALVLAGMTVRALVDCRRRDRDPVRMAQVVFALGLFLIVGLHSVVDYPLRSMSLAALAAVAVAFLTKPAALQQGKS